MPTPRADVHDFDFLKGIWSVANRRLKVRWKESHDWDEFPGTHFGHADHLGGIVNVDEMAFPSKGFSGWSVRIFDLEQRRWAIYWVDSRSGTLFPPVFGPRRVLRRRPRRRSPGEGAVPLDAARPRCGELGAVLLAGRKGLGKELGDEVHSDRLRRRVRCIVSIVWARSFVPARNAVGRTPPKPKTSPADRGRPR